MARPSSLSIIPIPQHQFPGLAVTQRDFRMDFCINNGSKSMPSMVPIYTPDNLDELLDEVSGSVLPLMKFFVSYAQLPTGVLET